MNKTELLKLIPTKVLLNAYLHSIGYLEGYNNYCDRYVERYHRAVYICISKFASYNPTPGKSHMLEYTPEVVKKELDTREHIERFAEVKANMKIEAQSKHAKNKHNYYFANKQPRERYDVILEYSVNAPNGKSQTPILCMLNDGKWYGLCGDLHYKRWKTSPYDVWRNP